MALDYQRFNVLYVDDEPGNLAAFSFAFEKRFGVHVAGSGEEALRMLLETPFAVLLADERMPSMTGSELCERARVISPDTIRMIMTAYADLEAAMKAINKGEVRRYLSKPWQDAEVEEALRTAIEVYHFQDMVNEMERKLMRDERAAGRLLGAALLDHQLRTQIMTLKVGMEGIARHAPSIPDPALSTDVAEVAGDCQQVLETMLGLLEAAKQGDVLKSDEPANADVARVVQLSIQHLRAQILKRAHYQIVSGGSPHAAIAPRELIQVLTNLLTNAWQSMPEGQAFRQRIDIKVSTEPGKVVIEVADTGCGITPEDMPRIFDLFFTTKRDSGGSGLGLHIVKTILALRKGTVTVQSEVGKGSTFTVKLPVVPG